MSDASDGMQVTIGGLTFNLRDFDDPAEAAAALSEALRGLESRDGTAPPSLDMGALKRIVEMAQRAANAPPAGAPAVKSPRPGRAPRRRQLPDTPSDVDGDTLDRFLSEAERHLAAPDAARRRETLAHLKAAVAAAEAERLLGGPQSGAERRRTSFRHDLDAAVRATPPAAGSHPDHHEDKDPA
ncbi:hypothetical protein [Rubellimicrobium arenae]|uniref:hypothetical protein n=1 Tax=Rubellimicrobium arenae TaxID=2817372 RepID=UPI001B317D29|nr:hypothetical protein [Rubellimicrobium arenae]